MTVVQGATYAASYTIPGGAVIGSTIVLTVTAPDGTITTPGVTQTVPAKASVPASQVGTYLLVWSTTGTVVDALTDQFTVLAPGLTLISLTDLKDQINVSQSDTAGDAKLRRFMQSATDVVQNICGPILPTPMTRVFRGGVPWVILPHRWVSSITSVTEFWGGATLFTLTATTPGQTPLSAYSYWWDPALSKITRVSAGFEANFKPGLAAVTVQYVAGMTTIPQDVTDATGELIRHWWAHGQTPGRGSFQAQPGDDTGTITVMGYSVPNRVIEMLAPYRRRVGIF